MRTLKETIIIVAGVLEWKACLARSRRSTEISDWETPGVHTRLSQAVVA